MSCEYREQYLENLANAVYHIVDNLSDDALHRMLEEFLIESAIDDQAFSWQLMHTPDVFMRQAETKAGYYHKG